MFLLSDIDPVLFPYHQWVSDYPEELPDHEIIELMIDRHIGVSKFFQVVASHPHANKIPACTSMMMLHIGHKMDFITIIYTPSDCTMSIDYETHGRVDAPCPHDRYMGTPDLGIPVIQLFLDFYVTRHKRVHQTTT